MVQAMKFKDLKQYISKLDRLSICSKETLCYENYHCIEIMLSEEPRFEEELVARDSETAGMTDIVSLLAKEVALWSDGKMDVIESQEIVLQYIDYFKLNMEDLIVKGLTWHAQEILTQTRNMQFENHSVFEDTFDEQTGARTFRGQVNEFRLFIMMGVPRKKLLEKGFSPYLLTAAYSHYSDEDVENAMIRRITKLIKENRTKEDILKKGYSEEIYEKAFQKLEEENGE